MKQLFTGLILMLGLYSYAQVDFQATQTDGCAPLGITIDVTSPDPASITSYFWEITTPAGDIITSSSPTYIAILSEPGGYDVSLTINGTDNTTIADYIVIHGIPEANFLVDDTEGCYPFCVNFNDVTISGGGSIVEWAWDFGDGEVSNEANPQYCYDETGTFTPVLSVEDEFGCFDDISMPGLISVSDDFPTASIDAGYQLNCAPPADFTFSNTSTGTLDLTYEWDFGDTQTATSTDESDVTHAFNGVGIYDVCLTAIDEIGCENTACAQVEVFDIAQAQFQISEDMICMGEEITFTDLTVPTPSSWSWDFDGDGVEDSSDPNPVYTYTAEGMFQPELTVTYTDDCQDTEAGAFTIDVQPELLIDFVADTMASCQTPFLVNFTNNTTGPGTLDYEWYINGAQVATSTDLAYNFVDFNTYDVELVVNSSAGCSVNLFNDDMIQILEPTVSFSNPTVICTEDPVPIFDIQANSIDPIVTWEWDFDGDNVTDATGSNPIYSYSTTGEFNITLDIWTEAGCFTTVTNVQTITVETQVDTEFSVSDTLICAGEIAEFCVNEQPGVSYSWNYGDGVGWDNYPYWQPCALHDFQDTGYFDITLSVFNDGCSHLITLDSAIYVAAPIALFEITQDCVDPYTVAFSDESIEAEVLTWDFGDGSPVVVGETDPNHTYPGPGTYQVSLTAYNSVTDCQDVSQQTVYIIPPDASINVDLVQGCPPLQVNFTDNGTNDYWYADFGNGDYLEVEWVINQYVATWTIEGEEFSDTFGANESFWPTMIYNELGTYDVTVSVVDDLGCTNSITYEDLITVSSSPTFAEFDINVIESCTSIDIEFVPIATNLTSWEWIFSDGTVVSDLSPQHTFLPPYDYDLYATLDAVDDLGCLSLVTQDIPVVPPATPVFGVVSDPSCQGDNIQLTNDSWGEIAGYSWDFGDPAMGADNFSDEEAPALVYANNGSFEICLTVENTAGCETTLCQPNLVNIINPVAEFDFDVNINNCLFGVQFENTTAGTVNCSEWIFGDGQFGTGLQVFHTYPIGVYDLEMVVCNEFGCYDTLMVPDIFDYGIVIGPFAPTLDTVSCAPMGVVFEAWNVNDTEFDYFWDFGDGFGDPDGSTQTTHEYTQPGEYCPSLIMTDQNGCPVLLQCEEPIIVDEFMIATSTVEEICEGENLEVTIFGGSDYTWADDTFVTVVNDSTYILEPSATTNFEVTGYYADCDAVQNFDLIVNQLPNVTLDMQTGVCFEEGEFALYGGLPNDNPGVYYVDGTASTDFDPSQTAGTVFDIVYEYTDDNGCVNTASSTLEINELPVVSLDPMADLCANDAVLALAGGSPVMGVDDLGVYTVDGAEMTDFDPAAGYGNYLVNYTYTDANGCVNEADQVLTVNPVPETAFSLLDPCLYEGLEVDNQSTIPVGTIADVDWDFDGMYSSNNFDPDGAPIVDGGVYSVTLTATSNEGCVEVLTQDLEVFAVPQADIEFTPDCEGEEFTITDASQENTGALQSWEWELDLIGDFSGAQISTPIDDYGLYPITLVVMGDGGCADTLTQSLEVYPNPEVAFEMTGLCEDILSEFTNMTSIAYSNIDSYDWQFGNGDASVDLDPSTIFFDTGIYPVTLTATSEYGCVGQETEDIQIYATPVADFTLSDSAFCAGADVLFVDQSTVEDPSNLSQFMWVIEGQTVGYSNELEYAFDAPGNFDITLMITSNYGCQDQITADDVVEVWPYPSSDFEAEVVQDDLLNMTMSFEDQSSGAVNWSYAFGDGAYGEGAYVEHQYESYGTYEVWQYVANEFGCTNSSSQIIEIDPEMLIYVPNAFTPDNDDRNEIFKPEISGFFIEQYTFQVWNRWGELMFETNDLSEGWIGNVQGGSYYAPEGVYVWKILIQNAYNWEIEEIAGHVTLIR